MKPTPVSLSSIAMLDALPSAEKRPISLLGANESVSTFEALLRATPGSRPTVMVASSQATDKTQVRLTDLAGELDLLGMESQSDRSSLPRPGKKTDDESDQVLGLQQEVASSVLPFWPANLGAAWAGALQAFASGANSSDGGGQTGSIQNELVQAGFVQTGQPQTGPVQPSLAVTALSADVNAPKGPVAAFGVAAWAARQIEIPVGFVAVDPDRETVPVLPALPGTPLSLTSADQAPAQVLAKPFNADMATTPRGNTVASFTPISKGVTSSFDLVPPQASPITMAVTLSGAVASKPGFRESSYVSEASGLRLSVEPQPLDSAGQVLAQFGAVSIYSKLNKLEQDRAPSVLAEAQQITDGRGAWVPELGGVAPPVEQFVSPVDFAQYLAEQVDTWVSQNLPVAELRWQESSSSPVLVRIEINGQQASVMFRTDVTAYRDALTTQMDQLSDLLSGQGLQLAGASVAGSGTDSQSGREARPNPVWVDRAAGRSVLETSGLSQSIPRRTPRDTGRALDVFV